MANATSYSRADLITLCALGVVPVEQWSNRDSSAAQEQLGRAGALLRAGCEYVLDADTDDRTIWVTVDYPGFSAFEYGQDDRGNWDSSYFYIPTKQRLQEQAGKDWY